jgi:serine phosphatase RsbU (regulator of sigma subunit)
LGGIYIVKKNYNISFAYFEKALKLKQELNDPVGIMRAENNLGYVNVLLGNYKKGIELCEKSLQESKELEHLEGIQYNCECLYKAYEKLKDNNNAFKFYKEYVLYKDSVINSQKLQDITKQEMLLDFTRQLYSDSIRRTEQQKIKDLELQKKQLKKEEELKRQKFYTYTGVIGFFVMIIFAFVLFRGYNTKKKANEIITKQKTEVEQQKEIVQEINKEIIDSIRYAQRIQEALLPDDDLIKDCFQKSFVFYKPRDIVSGDFYWINKIGNNIQFAVVDCTGHGVPGAFMSIIGYNGLNRCVGEYGLTKPNEILDKLGSIIRNALSHHKHNDNNVYDGMDIALCCLNTQNLILEYAGANSPLYLIQNNNLISIKADIQPVGAFIEEKLKPFKNHTFQLQKNDMIYLFSDGFADQFGGEKGKKFKYENFRNILSSISNKNETEQQLILADTFENWKGNLEQVDDVCVIGIRI